MNMVSPFNFDPFFSRTIGFEHIFERLNNIAEENLGAVGAYPPYNINRHSDGKFDIEIAVAGFGEEDLKVEKIKNELVVSGEIKGSDDETIHKGIATRKFKRTWVLADDVEVSNPSVRNGILYIPMVKVIPEEDKPQVLEFVDTKEFLSES